MFRRIYYNSVGQVSSDVYNEGDSMVQHVTRLLRDNVFLEEDLEAVTIKYRNGETFVYLRDS